MDPSAGQMFDLFNNSVSGQKVSGPAAKQLAGIGETRYGELSLSGTVRTLPGPTRERNFTYRLLPRERVLCPGRQPSRFVDPKGQSANK
ncbi:MAG: hypothetical protein G5663_00605 [Serratia symbiotica]|nr:hypothetical protein [Serratia symbiotica]